MVAGAGAAMTSAGYGPWGHGGALTSNDAYYSYYGRTYVAAGATQTGSGVGSYNIRGSFGAGANGGSTNRAGGGGGYYGGNVAGTSYGGNAGAASGGSSFISGYNGCDAIAESSTADNIVHTGQNVHYSGFQFKNTEMISGMNTMPTHDGSNVMTGNYGNGFAKITLLENPSGDNLLKELQISFGGREHTITAINPNNEESVARGDGDTYNILSPNMEYGVDEYTVTGLSPEDTDLTVYGVQNDIKATVSGNGTFKIPASTSTNPYQIKLNVTAESGAVREYTLNVVRDASDNGKPLNIQIDGLVESLISVNRKIWKT